MPFFPSLGGGGSWECLEQGGEEKRGSEHAISPLEKGGPSGDRRHLLLLLLLGVQHHRGGRGGEVRTQDHQFLASGDRGRGRVTVVAAHTLGARWREVSGGRSVGGEKEGEINVFALPRNNSSAAADSLPSSPKGPSLLVPCTDLGVDRRPAADTPSH